MAQSPQVDTRNHPDVSSPRGRILLVDDKIENLNLLTRLLTRSQYHVEGVQNGGEALRVIYQDPPDLILLDIDMPDMSGYEVCERLKQDPRTADIPIIFISGLDKTGNILKGFEVGGVDYITKPFKVREVLARVDSQVTLAQQRKQLEILRERDCQRFEAIGQMHQRFVSNATHDLKNPLAAIIGYVQLMETLDEVRQSESLLKYLQQIRRGTDKMRMLITDMLDLLQMDSYRFELKDTISLNRFVQAAAEDLRTMADQNGIRLHVVPAQPDVQLTVNEAQLQRMMDNLITNAIKYTPDGGDVTVEAGVQDSYAVIQVRDNGIGIPEEAQDQLFEAFYRVKDKQHDRIEGTGLGLSIVKAIVEQHGGEITVESAVGQGSAFTVYLPLGS